MSNLSADTIRHQEELSDSNLKSKKSLAEEDVNTTIVSSTTTGPTLEEEIKSNEPMEVLNLEKEREEAAPSVLQKATEGTAAVLQAAGDTIGQVAGTAKDVAVSATEKLSHVYSDTLQPAAAVVGEKLSNAAHLAVDKVVEAKDALTAPETTEKVSHLMQDTKDMIVSAAVVTKDTVVESAHVVGNVADKIYHWVADAVVPQMKDQVEAVTETASNALATTAEFVTTQVGEVKEKAKELISGGEVEKQVEDIKEDLKPEEKKDDLKKEEPIKQQKEEVKEIAKSSGLEASSGKKDDGMEPSPLINMEVFPKGNIPTTKTRTMVGSTITRESEFGKYLQRNDIIPNVFANYFDDTYHFDMEFGANTFSGHINREPYLFAPGQVASQPNIYLKKQMKGGINVPSLSNFLGLAMVDADFWSKDLKIGDKKEFIHWLVMNIPAANITNSFRIPVEQGQELVSFMPSQPEQGTGIHKYMFFLFEYDHKMNFDTFDRILDSKDLEKRANMDFKIERFSNDYNIGAPVGFFMYQCKNENE